MGHTFRLESDALNRGPIDLVFVEAAVNDHNYDGNPDSAIYALRGMEGVVRKLRIVNPMTDIVKMHFIHDIHLQTYQQGKVPYTIEQHERVADYYGCPSLNLSKEVSDRINAGEFTWDNDFCNLHPSPYGQRVYANSMTRMLDAAFAQSTIPKAHNIPSKPLDAHSFFYGRYGRLQDAKLVKGFILDTCWKPKGTQEYRTGFANCPALVADNPGAELSYTFKGTAFGFFIAAGSDTGIIEFSIDHAPFKELDTWTSWSGSLHLPWVLMLAEDLTPGKHKVIVRTTNKAKERCALHIIHILIN
jgi:sialidase-1